ncbi:hypothetical protein BDF21DRAFT_359514 [Thamnidium elegans]|uniref:RING-CH-type domain-containing protein n=1 Tax=Thamnidium elegans TaxID=101142 RepID=A0A8H7VXV0_9FUNG|nr:hypothetical protein INT48_002940 [Thamnidium elegans]KAI8085420.1 hypothetical protein BDF21DRAFT_359514 [Thamnidium elegans]
MSHFRCPSSSLVEEAGLFEYQAIKGLDESQLYTEDEDETTCNKVDTNKRCWICFGEDTDSVGRWVNPCNCSLVSHEQCLLDWIAENQKITPLKKVTCPQCSSSYYLSERHSLPLVLMSIVDSLVHTAAPYVTVLGLGCSLLITSTTFGAYTVLTLFGTKQGEKLIGNPAFWTWKTWIGLPCIPLVLIASRLKWADNALPAATLLLLRLTGVSYPLKVTWPPSPAVLFGLLPWVRLLYNNIYALIQLRLSLQRRNEVATVNNQRVDERESEFLFGREGRDMGVTVIGALLWPSIGSVVGGYLGHSKSVRRYFPEPFQRNVLGGCLFVLAKDIANLVYRYERIRQRRSRRVVNFNDIKRRAK